MNVALPRFSRFVIRWKLIIVVLWVFLLSMALYSNLSFDGHKILGLSTDATEKQIKKRYRVLSKQYHPDHNPGNQTSLQIYTQVVKAYKSLVNKEEFEEEARKEDLSVGVALPSFLTNRDNELMIKIVVLLALIGLPLFVYKKFAGDDADKIQDLTQKIYKSEMRLVPLLKAFGIPDEKKFHQLAAQVELYTMCWKACGIPVQDPLQMEYLPPIEEFLKRSATPALVQQNAQTFAQMGIPGPDQVSAAADFLKKGQEMLKEDEEKITWSEEIKPISDSQFEVAIYMMQLAMEDCEQYIAELNAVVNNSIQQIHKLSQHHQKMLQILVLNQQKKIEPKDQEGLRALARASKANALAILPAIQRTMQNFQAQQQAAMNGMKQQ